MVISSSIIPPDKYTQYLHFVQKFHVSDTWTAGKFTSFPATSNFQVTSLEKVLCLYILQPLTSYSMSLYLRVKDVFVSDIIEWDSNGR